MIYDVFVNLLGELPDTPEGVMVWVFMLEFVMYFFQLFVYGLILPTIRINKR